jgi:alpha-D-xyloside xylohydrolase
LLIDSDPSTTSVLSAGQPQTIASVRVYAGADADFTLFTDDGTTYAYEKGGGSITKLHWDEAHEKLTHEGAAAWSGLDASIVDVIH